MTDKSVGQLEDRHCPEDTQHRAQDTNIEFYIPHSLKKKKRWEEPAMAEHCCNLSTQGMLRWEDFCGFEANLGYIARLYLW